MAEFVNARSANDYMTGRKPLPVPRGAEVVAARFTIALEVGDFTASDIGAFAKLPAGCIPVDAIVDCTDVDTGAAAMVLTFGVLESAAATALSTTDANGGGAWGATTASNAAFTQRLTFTGGNMMSVQADDANERLVGCIVTTAPTTAAAGTLGLTLFYRNAD